ncbi:Hypothetical protein NTJ_03739 [Nesidiocoris tenuis]|uniref:Uncharacterized protein n=1 Tax=Nesidiocoris tenuis TaxID=355587 RepID=A0ABN7AJ76_9HEMI|nr:Hypothetical protein NTJ_03739 [Nesidiocoris tenuis]
MQKEKKKVEKQCCRWMMLRVHRKKLFSRLFLRPLPDKAHHEMAPWSFLSWWALRRLSSLNTPVMPVEDEADGKGGDATTAEE